MDNRENYAEEDTGKCMTPYPLYWTVVIPQYMKLHAGYRQWIIDTVYYFTSRSFHWDFDFVRTKGPWRTDKKFIKNLLFYSR